MDFLRGSVNLKDLNLNEDFICSNSKIRFLRFDYLRFLLYVLHICLHNYFTQIINRYQIGICDTHSLKWK